MFEPKPKDGFQPAPGQKPKTDPIKPTPEGGIPYDDDIPFAAVINTW